MKLLLSSATITIATLLLLCIQSVSAQEIDVIQAVIDEVMEVYCFTPCSDGFTGDEVIPGTKCQFFMVICSGLKLCVFSRRVHLIAHLCSDWQYVQLLHKDL